MICILKFTKGYKAVKSVVIVTELVLCTSSGIVLFVYQVLPNYFKGFQSYRPEQ